jgi:hypothetical protein
MQTWQDVFAVCQARFTNISFAPDTFLSLEGRPFVHGAAERIVARLTVLSRLMQCVDERGAYTPEGYQIELQYFRGPKADFSPSSDTEMRDFEKELTFRHPDRPDATLFCPMHAKIKAPQLRIHFSWPIRIQEKLYVVYVGPKITKR